MLRDTPFSNQCRGLILKKRPHRRQATADNASCWTRSKRPESHGRIARLKVQHGIRCPDPEEGSSPSFILLHSAAGPSRSGGLLFGTSFRVEF